MAHLRIALKFLALILVLCTPFAALGWILGGPIGACVVAAIVLAVVLLLWFNAEKIIARGHKAVDSLPAGLSETFNRAIERMPRRYELPKLWVYSDSAPNLLVVAHPGAGGAVLLSQGLLASLNEAELRATIRAAVRRCASHDLRFQSLCCVLASVVLKMAPSEWVAFFLGTSGRVMTSSRKSNPESDRTTQSILSFLRFICIRPLAAGLIWIGGDGAVVAQNVSSTNQALESAMVDALRKVEAATGTPSAEAHYGAVSLYLRNPWRQTSLMT